MKFLILGSSEMIGHVVALYLQEKGHEVIGYDENDSDILKCDVGSFYDLDKIRKLIFKENPTAVVNCTAIINQFAEEDKERAVYINSYIPHWLESITRDTTIKVVHRSTDCIFSGDKGNYTLVDMADAPSFYAKTKAVGELDNQKDITIRTSLIGPERTEQGSSLLNWYLTQQGEIKGYANAIWTGITTLEFAKEIEYLVKNNLYGIFHCVPQRSISKFELLKIFEKYFPNSRKIVPIDNKRVDKSLVQEIHMCGMNIPDYDEMILEMKQWIQEHSSLYPKYYN